jgi:hypothetical protein
MRSTTKTQLREVKKDYPQVKESTVRIKLGMQPATTYRARRLAKKRFKKGKQVPAGYTLLYKLGTTIDSNPQPTERLKAEWAYLDMRSMEMFKKKYDSLTTRQQAKLIESFHRDDA